MKIMNRLESFDQSLEVEIDKNDYLPYINFI